LIASKKFIQVKIGGVIFGPLYTTSRQRIPLFQNSVVTEFEFQFFVMIEQALTSHLPPTKRTKVIHCHANPKMELLKEDVSHEDGGDSATGDLRETQTETFLDHDSLGEIADSPTKSLKEISKGPLQVESEEPDYLLGDSLHTNLVEFQTIITGHDYFLRKGRFPDQHLLFQCVKDIEGKLSVTPEIVVFGKIVKQRRNIGFYSDSSIGYYYSRTLMKSTPLESSLASLLQVVNNIFGAEFNGILVNHYLSGSDCIGAHSDDESSLDPAAGVVSISFGASRNFRIRDKQTRKIVKDIPTPSGLILVMGGQFQRYFTHEIPIEKRVSLPRYSFTFRKHDR
jgi:alkylated DNA repair dioxygenase AlkB